MSSQGAVILVKLLVEFGKTRDAWNLFLIGRAGPVPNRSHFVIVHSNAACGDNEAEKGIGRFVEHTLDIKVSKRHWNTLLLYVFFYRSGKNKRVIQVNKNKEIDHVSENVVH